MTERSRSTAFVLSGSQGGVLRFARMIAAIFTVLVASPFTEPFAVCAPSALTGSPAVQAAVVPTTPVVAPARREAGYPPLSLTDDQLKNSKDVLATQDLLVAERLSDTAEPPTASAPVAGMFRPAPLILRL